MRRLLLAIWLIAASPALAVTVGDYTITCDLGGSSDSADPTSPAPSDIQDGDVLVGLYGYGEEQYITDVTMSGFTQIAYEEDTLGSDTTVAAFYRVASSESGSYQAVGSETGGDEGSILHVCKIRPVDQSNVLDVSYVTGSHYVKHENDTTPTAQPITTATDDALVLVFQYVRFTSVTDFVCPGTPGTWTEISEFTTGSDRESNVCVYQAPTAGTVTPGQQANVDQGGGQETAMLTLAFRLETSSGALLLRRRK